MIKLKYLSAAIVLVSSLAFAAQQTINVGTVANDGTGDTLRAAMVKTQANFTDLYTNKQPLDADLTAIAAISPTNDDFIQRKAGAWINRTMAQLKVDLALNNVVNVDTSNANNISSGTLPAGRLPALTGDVTSSAGSAATTIATGVVTDAKASLAVKPPSTVAATTNQSLTGLPTIDGVSVVDGSIVLASAQSAGAENGPWVTHSGAWTRPIWYASGSTTQAFQYITTMVRVGTTYQGTTWRQTAPAPITIDTTATVWAVTPLALNASTITSVAPITWAGIQTFSEIPVLSKALGSGTDIGSITATNAAPTYTWVESDQAANSQLWQARVQTGVLSIGSNVDANSAFATGLSMARSGGTIGNVTIGNSGNNPTVTIAGTGLFTLNGAAILNSTVTNVNTVPTSRWQESDQGTDLKVWQRQVNGAVLTESTLTDALAAGKNWLAVTRGATTAIGDLSLGNATDNNTFNFLGTGAVGVGGAVNVSGQLTAGQTVGGGLWGVKVASIFPAVLFSDTNGAANAKNVDIRNDTNIFSINLLNDSLTTGTSIFAATRSVGAVTNVSVGNATDNNTFNFLGTGTVTAGGSFSTVFDFLGRKLQVTSGSASVPVNGISSPGTNRLGMYSNSTLRGEFDAGGQFKISSIGAGLSVAEGSNAKMGTCTLTAGACTMSTTAVTATSRIFCTSQVDGGTPGYLRVSTRTAGTSYVVTSGSGSDTSTIACMIVEPS